MPENIMPKGLMSAICAVMTLSLTQAQTADDLRQATAKGDHTSFEQLVARAELGDTLAQVTLGELYIFGAREAGVNVNLIAAHMWLRLAAAHGAVVVKEETDALEGLMTPEQVSQARTLAEEWKPKPVTPQQIAQARQFAKEWTALREATFEIALRRQGGVLLLPALINNKITLDFVLDSGASDVSVPADVVLTLMRTGTLTAADFTGTSTYVLADGSKVPSQTFRIRSLKVGDHILENVSASVASVNGSLLLGQSFLGRFRSWSIDNTRQILLLR